MVDGRSRRTLDVIYVMFKVVMYGMSYGPNMNCVFLFVCVRAFRAKHLSIDTVGSSSSSSLGSLLPYYAVILKVNGDVQGCNQDFSKGGGGSHYVKQRVPT